VCSENQTLARRLKIQSLQNGIKSQDKLKMDTNQRKKQRKKSKGDDDQGKESKTLSSNKAPVQSQE
jgi:hypothetical protein